MSRTDAQDPALNELVRAIAEAVLRRLEADAAQATEPGGARVLWMLAAPAAHLGRLAREMGVLHRLGHRQRVVGCDDALAALQAEALPAGVQVDAPGASASERLAAVADADVVYLGSLRWAQAAALAAVQDGDDWVAAALEAVAQETPVRVVVGDDLGGLHRFGPGAAAKGRLASVAAERWRALEPLGVTPLALDALGAPLAGLEANQHSWGRALGGLLGEADVSRAAAEGMRELRLPAGTVVTPLAADRARELGLVIRKT